MALKIRNSNNHKNELTRDRLLDEAEDLFSQRGYHAVSVREITKAAESNLAAVNYHFGNKQNLYLEVFRSRWLPRASQIQQSFKQSLKNSGNPTPTMVVQSFARAFLEGPMSADERTRHFKLISGELVQPTEAFELVVEQVFRPLFGKFLEDLRKVMPDTVDEKQMILNVFSILSMVLYFNFARPLITTFVGGQEHNDIETRLVDHIVQFSLSGVGSVKEEVGK
ncbi:Transcriptional regulator, AcrR family [Olavius sp. associated proteobacterium Delta 1]|nr:Transcriptional regulator, AcrR family [Olavius sp. associated proteobacterium Delta 1]